MTKSNRTQIRTWSGGVSSRKNSPQAIPLSIDRHKGYADWFNHLEHFARRPQETGQLVDGEDNDVVRFLIGGKQNLASRGNGKIARRLALRWNILNECQS